MTDFSEAALYLKVNFLQSKSALFVISLHRHQSPLKFKGQVPPTRTLCLHGYDPRIPCQTKNN
jgi:hypothetical protein